MFFKATDNLVFDRIDISKYTLVLPAISVGNVGQLTVDILITTTQAENIGSIYDDSLLPLIGNDPYIPADSSKSCRLSTCCNVYIAKVEKLIFIQQRASFVKGKRKQFRDKLIQWIKERQFRQVFLIGSTFAHMRTDQQIEGTQFRYLATDEAKSLVRIGADSVELEDTPDEYGRMDKRLPGSGIAKTLFADCCRERIALVELLLFCSDGDNSPDALRMAEYANTWLNVVGRSESPSMCDEISVGLAHCLRQYQIRDGVIHPFQTRHTVAELKSVWKIPQSWQLNYGSSYNQIIY